MSCFKFKKIMKGKNYITPMDFTEHLIENQTFQRTAKFIMVNFYEMDFMKGNVTLVKADEMYNILKSASHSLFHKG